MQISLLSPFLPKSPRFQPQNLLLSRLKSKSTKPPSTTQGPKQNQTLVMYNSDDGWKVSQPNILITRMNMSLTACGLDLRILLTCSRYTLVP